MTPGAAPAPEMRRKKLPIVENHRELAKEQ